MKKNRKPLKQNHLNFLEKTILKKKKCHIQNKILIQKVKVKVNLKVIYLFIKQLFQAKNQIKSQFKLIKFKLKNIAMFNHQAIWLFINQFIIGKQSNKKTV